MQGWLRNIALKWPSILPSSRSLLAHLLSRTCRSRIWSLIGWSLNVTGICSTTCGVALLSVALYLLAWSMTVAGACVWVIKAVVLSRRRHVNQRLTFMPQDCRKYMEMNVDRERLHICCFTQRPSLNCINRIRNQFCYTWQQIKGGYVHIPHDFFATFHLQSAYLAIYIHAVRLLIFSFK